VPAAGVRAAIYNRFWHSMGGGERHSAMIAQVLAADGASVELIGHSDVDLDALARHLGLDLTGCVFRKIPDRGEASLALLSGDYDLFVNASYMSRLAPKAARSAYLCFFPTPADHDSPAWRKAAIRVAGPVLRGVRPAVTYGAGWYPPEGGRRRQWVWTNGEGVLSVAAGGGADRELRADIGRPGAAGPTTVAVRDLEGHVLTKLEVRPEFGPVTVTVPPSERGTELVLVSDTFNPADGVPDSTDVRQLGVAVSRARLSEGDESPRARAALRFPWLLRDPRDLRYLDAYTVVLANSGYTRNWVGRLWHRDAPILYPPIQTSRLTPAPEREKAVLAVGRFFAPGLGHAKRQLEMVGWFGELHRAGALPGWRMHVVGGCEPSQRPYLEQVRAAARDLPVDIHPNAPREDVERLLSTCAVFWSATGFSDDEKRRPWTAEHFGMTTVEAMAGGCVPVVIDRAGQREIVRHGIDGFRWNTPAELASLTRRLAAEEPMRGRLAAAAVERAAAYSDAAFADRWRTIAATHDLYGR
jgi:glycosyltransferase involved in cell wall biosynthesis